MHIEKLNMYYLPKKYGTYYFEKGNASLESTEGKKIRNM
jgi:hypothetical protein